MICPSIARPARGGKGAPRRADTTFTDRKLTREEFAQKYWHENDPDYIYQYHTMDIEDGRDEREQLIINNIRALFLLRQGVNALQRGRVRVTLTEIEKLIDRKLKWLQPIKYLCSLIKPSFGP